MGNEENRELYSGEMERGGGGGVAGGVLSLGICKGENTRMRGLKQFCFVALKIKVRIMAGGVYLFCLKGFLIFSTSAPCRACGKYQKQKEDNSKRDHCICSKNDT